VCRIVCVVRKFNELVFDYDSKKNIYFQDGGLTATIALWHMSMSFDHETPALVLCERFVRY
jgi:hypothetical protein